MDQYYSCCGKSVCGGCSYTFCKSGNYAHCVFCKAEQVNKTVAEHAEYVKRAEANDPILIYMLASCYYNGRAGFQQDRIKAIDLYARAAELG
jgi:TPR repeat protein